MSKNPKNCLRGISEDTAQSVIKFYSEPNSQKETAKQFGLTLYALIQLLKKMNASRSKYSLERSKLISKGVKKAHKENPEIVKARIKLHTGSKRTEESRKRMQESAWKRMAKQKDKYVSKAETQFGNFLENKLGLKVIRQYRFGLKPFDFLVDDRVLVEFDGPHHYDPDYYMCKSGKINFEQQQKRDNKRQEIADQLGLKLIIIRQKDVDKNMCLQGDAMHKFMGDLGYVVL